MKEVKVAIMGSGFIAEHHLYSLNLLPNVEIMCLSSRNQETARELLNKFNLPTNLYMDYNELLKLDCDAVSICLPNYLHKDITLDLLDSGKHVLIEKPLAMNVEEGIEMVDKAKSSNRNIYYCENNMYAPSFNKVKEVLKEGALGEIYMARGKEQHSGPHSEWFYKKDKAGGGALIDLGIHDIAVLVWFLEKEVREVFCQIKTVLKNRKEFGKCEVEDNAVGVLYFENDAQVIIEESWTSPGGYDIRYELYGLDGQLKVAPTFSNLISVYSETGYGYAVEKAGTTKGWTFPVPAESWTFGYPKEMKHFVECIVENKKSFTDGNYGLKILKIVDAMYKSAKSNKIEVVNF
ncbi:MAG: Gfo/Idh/MocA family protein [Candidatus Hermodarchaeota archaeon]